MTNSHDPAQELAERFVNFCADALVSGNMNWPLAKQTLAKEIENALVEAVAEEKKNCPLAHWDYSRERQHAVDQARLGERERCAKIADTFEFNSCPSDGHDERWCSFCDAVQHASDSIARDIRAWPKRVTPPRS